MTPSHDSKLAHPPHPFYPTEMELLGYLANSWNVPTLLGAFAAVNAAVLGSTYMIARLRNPGLSNPDMLCVIWFVFTGSIHLWFEGYFALNHHRMPGMSDFFGQLWKEYSLSDSRYMTSDPFVLCMESITAVLWGPASYLTAYLITTQSAFRHPLQALVSTGQLYGDVLYYATSLFDHYFRGVAYCRPEAYYFWIYYFLMNFFWIVIPGYLLFQSTIATAEAFRACQAMRLSRKAL